MVLKHGAALSSLLLASLIVASGTLFAKEKTQSIILDSEILGEQREILVSLPDSYDRTQSDYAVLVTTDAELIHEFAYGTSLYLSRQGEAPELIVVGIVNTDREKRLYYEVDNFTAFLEDELAPFIDERFRTNGLRILFGFSSGTVPVDTLLFSDSDLFSLYISAGWGMSDSGYARLSKSLDQIEFSGQRVFFSTEGETVRRKNVENFLADLDRVSPGNLTWKGHIYEGMDHGDVMTRGLHDGLEYLFNDWEIPGNLSEKGITGLEQHEQALRQRFSRPVRLQSETIASAAFGLLHTGDERHAAAATALLEEAVRRKPWGGDMLAYLAYAQWQYGDLDQARNTMREAIELAEDFSDPQLADFENRLREWMKTE